MFSRIALALATFSTLSFLAPAAEAGGLSIGFSKHGRHGSVGVWIGGGPSCAPAPRPPSYGGHWETVVERVWVPGSAQQVWIEPVYQTRYDSCGRPYQVCVRAGYWTTVQSPGHWEERQRQVWRHSAWRHGR